MSTGHSWKWLAPRLNAEQLRDAVRAAAAAETRPCLPTVETLGDRMMLSVSAIDVELPEQEAVSPDEILIGLIKGELLDSNALVKHELNVVDLLGDPEKPFGNVNYGDVRQMNQGMVKINEILSKAFSEAATSKVADFVKIKLDLERAVSKITDIANKIDGGISESKIDKAVAAVASKAEVLYKFMTDALIQFSAENNAYVKVNDYVADALTGYLKLREDRVLNKSTTGDLKYLEIKLQDVLVSSARVGIKGEIKLDTDGLPQFELLKEIETDGGGGGGGGILIEIDGGGGGSKTGDILK